MGSHLLSKSSFIKGLQCEKHLYLYKYHYDEMDDLSEMQKAIFQRGTDVGELAQQLFPGGTIATEGNPPDYDKGLKRTAELIREGTSVLYEASFRYNEVLAISDIIVRAEEGSSRRSEAKPEWNIYEVKSSTSVSDAIINDAALQYYVLSNTGLSIKDFFIIYINNQYVRQGELNLNELFVIESVLEQAKQLQEFVEENVERLKKVLTKNHIPDVDIGEHCHTPYTCSFFNYCRKDLPEYSIFNFNGMHLNKKYELYNKGIIKLDDIPDDYPLNKNNKLQLEVYKSGEPLID